MLCVCGLTPCSCGLQGGCEFALQDEGTIQNSLAAGLIHVADQARQIAVCLGTRPYRVTLVWVRWSGGRRGVGVEEIAREETILPTPLVRWFDGPLERDLWEVGATEVGTVQVQQISGRYSEDFLVGRDDAGLLGDDIDFFWEVQFLPPGGVPGAAPMKRRRFVVKTIPAYRAEDIEWRVALVRHTGDRTRDGGISWPST
jgi:hypothetical protein